MPSATNSNYLAQKQMNHLLKGETWTPPTTIYVALFATVPNLDGTGGSEISTSGTGYARKPIQQGAGWVGATGSTMTYSNAQDVVWDTPTATWGTIRGIGLFDAAVDGNLLYVGYLSAAKLVERSDNPPRILANQLRLLRATC